MKAMAALLAVKGDNASAAELASEMSLLDYEIEVLSSISTELFEKVNKSVPLCYIDGLPHELTNTVVLYEVLMTETCLNFLVSA